MRDREGNDFVQIMPTEYQQDEIDELFGLLERIAVAVETIAGLRVTEEPT